LEIGHYLKGGVVCGNHAEQVDVAAFVDAGFGFGLLEDAACRLIVEVSLGIAAGKQPQRRPEGFPVSA
jgi:hypothetical protein